MTTSPVMHEFLALSAGPVVDYAALPPVIMQFEQICSMRPDSIAVHAGSAAISYRELHEMANFVAQPLLECMSDCGRRTAGLLFNGGLEVLVSMLACMKSGVTFVPLDTQWPEERCRQLLQRISPDVLLVSAGGQESSIYPQATTVEVDCTRRLRTENLPMSPQRSAEDVVYGYFTSGSTGLPKCALNRDRGLRNRFAVMTHRFRLIPGSRVLQNSKHVFDSALWQLLWPLTWGGTVVIPAAARGLDLEGTFELIGKHRVAMTDFVPSVFNLLVERMRIDPAAREAVRSFRYILVGGEAINPKAVFAFMEMAPEAHVINTYGPTEASIGMVFHDVDDDDRARGDIPLGRPIDNTALLVLDEERRPVPSGTIGEAYVGGIGVGPGYLGEQDRTQELFLPNPFAPTFGATLYRTGDLVHWDERGRLRFNGRIDEQLKIEGVRVDPSEIEHCLLGHPSVAEAKVLSHAPADASQRLIAFVVGRDVEADSLRHHAASLLPRVMVPSEIVAVDSMPLTHNGKLDRAKLLQTLALAPGRAAWEADKPRTETEAKIAGMLRTLLGVSRVGRNQPLCMLNVTSLQTIHLLLRLEEQFHVRLKPQEFAAIQTVAEIASRIENPGTTVHSACQEGTAERDALLPMNIAVTSSSDRPVENVLLTGGTGFIGAHVLEVLSKRARVRCLIRAEDGAAAWSKLQDTLSRLRIRIDPTRVEVVCGDVTQTRFGLNAEQFGALCATTDAVISCAAVVDLFRSYEHHRATNVAGTIEALHFAAMARGKCFHHVGSASSKSTDPAPSGGYDRSKWVAERLVLQASERGLRTRIHRVGEAMPDVQRGVPNGLSLAHALLQSGVALRSFPFSHAAIDYTPVNYIAEVIARSCVGDVENLPGVCDLAWPQPTRFADLVVLLAYMGTVLNFVPVSTFLEQLRHAGTVRDVATEILVAYTALREQGAAADSDDLLAALFPRWPSDVPSPAVPNPYAMMGIATGRIDSRVFRAYALQLAERGLCMSEALGDVAVGEGREPSCVELPAHMLQVGLADGWTQATIVS